MSDRRWAEGAVSAVSRATLFFFISDANLHCLKLFFCVMLRVEPNNASLTFTLINGFISCPQS